MFFLAHSTFVPTVAPDIPENDDDDDSEDHKVAAKLHDHTYGITSDPLTRFSAAFSALIHDVGKFSTTPC